MLSNSSDIPIPYKVIVTVWSFLILEESSMPKRNDSILDDLALLPWWVSVTFAAVIYVSLKYLVPLINFKDWMFRGIPAAAPGLAPSCWNISDSSSRIGCQFLAQRAVARKAKRCREHQVDFLAGIRGTCGRSIQEKRLSSDREWWRRTRRRS